MQFTSLFSPLRIGDIELKNRVFMAPLTRLRSLEPGDIPTKLMAEYYAQRAGAGLIITEATQISPQGKGYAGAPGLYNQSQIAAWQEITHAIHQQQGHVAVQLWHVGRISHFSLQPNQQPPVAPSAITANTRTSLRDNSGKVTRVDCSPPRALTLEEIPGIINDYSQAVLNARSANFDFVEIHAAHGYLLHQFMSPEANQRTDQYGGSIENRIRLTLEVIDAAIAAWKAKHIGIRISPLGPFNGVDNKNDQKECALQLLRALNQCKLAYVHISEPDWAGGEPYSTSFRQAIRNAYEGVIIGAGGYDAEKAENMINAGWIDAAAFGRAYIANPDLAERFHQGVPLNSLRPETLYGGDATGYTDYPSFTYTQIT